VTVIATQDFRLSSLDVKSVLAALGFPAGGDKSGLSYTVIRGNNGPRWLLPNGSRMARAILREWRPYGRATHFLWRGLRTAARLGALPLVPGTAQIRLPREAGKLLLRRCGFEGGAQAPVILVGNTESTRKLLIFLDAADRGNVVIKIPLMPHARASIGNEAEVLKRLDGRLGAPRLLGYHLDTGVAMQEYLNGRLGSRRLRADYLKLLVDLARCGVGQSGLGRSGSARGKETVTLREKATALRGRLRAHGAGGKQNAPVDGGIGQVIERALGLLEDDTPLPAALVHGDFAPWNIRDRENGGCALIDWESAEWAGLPLHDLCHFFCMQAKLFAPETLFFEEMERDGAWRRYCAELEIPQTLLKPLAAAFLLEALARAQEWGPQESAAFYLTQLERFLESRGRTGR
jgi:hypothetical protein